MVIAQRKGGSTLIKRKSPLVRSLLEVFGGRFSPTGKFETPQGVEHAPGLARHGGLKPRCDIVNEKLCDDVIEYLAPSLERYKGCTLLDIHPGACLWSRKLHDFLRPKHHLLMEPEKHYIERFIKPLLERPDSTYRHTFLSGAHPKSFWMNYREILADEQYLHSMPVLALDDPKRLELNPHVLVTGNLARRYGDQRFDSKQSPFAQLMTHSMIWAALSNTLFHRSGRVRMLWWMPETHQSTVEATNTSSVSSYMKGLRLGAEITKVVGINSLTSGIVRGVGHAQTRPEHLVREGRQQVQQRMDKAGIHVPDGREVHDIETFNTHVEPIEARSPLAIRHTNPQDLDQVVSDLEARCDTLLKASLMPRTGKVDPMIYEGIEYPQFHTIIQDQNPLTTSRFSVPQIDAQLRLINLEAHHHHFAEQGADVRALHARLLALDTRLYAIVDTVLARKDSSYRVIEDQIAFYASPQLLSLDRRTYEPLQAAPEDFWPHFALELRDVTPTACELRVPGLADTRETVATTQHLLKYLFANPKLPLPAALDKIAPNAAQDLIPMVPELTDARRGGRLNVHRMKVRMLNESMVEGLVKAWFEWPFRPSAADLAMASMYGERETVASAESVMEA